MKHQRLTDDTIKAMQTMLLGNRVKVTGCKSKNLMPDGTYNFGNVVGECTFSDTIHTFHLLVYKLQ